MYMYKKLKKYRIFVIVLCAIFYGCYIYFINTTSMVPTINTNAIMDKREQPNLGLHATSAILMDASSYRVLYEKNGYKQLPMASTTKIMTLIIALEKGNLNDIVVVSSKAAKMPDVQLGIREGEKYKLKDLLYSLMLESHNDSAVAIAEHIGGSVEEFAAMMNEKAEEIGCMNTYYITPNGLDATKQVTDNDGNIVERTHSTTAVDLGRVMSYCIMESPQKETFISITRTQNYSFQDQLGRRHFTCNNHNAFLNMMDGALSGKTGFTGAAGYCYVGALERDGKTLVVALLACGWPNNKTYKWSDTKKLMNYGLDNYSMCYINENKKILEPIDVVNGQQKQVNINAIEKDIKLLIGKDETTRVEYDIPNSLTAPVKEKKVIGNIKYYINDTLYDTIPVYSMNSVEEIDYEYCFKQIYNMWMLQK